MEGRPVAAGVQGRDRLAVQAELGPGGDLGELLQRAQAAGQRHERVGELVHRLLALVHGAHLDELRQPRVRDLVADQMARDHADHLPAGRQRGVRQHTHQPDGGAPVDHRDAVAREQFAERPGGVGEIRPGPGRRPAIHTDT